MPSNRSKYSEEMRTQTAAYILESGKPAREPEELKYKIRQLEKQLKEKDKELEEQKKKLEEERMNVEILKKSLHIFMQPHE